MFLFFVIEKIILKMFIFWCQFRVSCSISFAHSYCYVIIIMLNPWIIFSGTCPSLALHWCQILISISVFLSKLIKWIVVYGWNCKKFILLYGGLVFLTFLFWGSDLSTADMILEGFGVLQCLQCVTSIVVVVDQTWEFLCWPTGDLCWVTHPGLIFVQNLSYFISATLSISTHPNSSNFSGKKND